MTRVLDYFFAARPMLLLPVWSIYLAALHYHHELTGKQFSLENLAVMAGLSFMMAGGCYINQIYDKATDRANQKVLFLQNGLVDETTLMKLFILFSIIPVAAAAFYSKALFFIFLQLFGLGFIYSAPPFRLKDRPITGLLVNSYAFGFLITVSIMPEISQHNIGLLGWDNPIYFFLSVMGVHILTTLPDAPGDRASQKRTIGVILPKWLAVLLSFLVFAAASLVALNSGFIILSVIAGISAAVTLGAMIISNERLVLFSAKLPILLLTLLAGYFYPIYLLIVVALIFVVRTYYQRRFSITYPNLA